MTVDARPASAFPQATWLAASAAALVAVAIANAAAGHQRWWANFVLLPGAAMVAAAVPLMRSGRQRAAVGYAVLCAGVLVCAVGGLLLFGAMGRGWPLMIVLPCLAVAGTARWRVADASARASHRTVVGLAGLGVVLGATFLAIEAGLDLGDGRWWSFFMMAAGAVAIGNGLSLVGDVRGYRLPTTVLLAGLGAGAVFAGLRELLWR
jgi:hypothetical protein